MMEQVNMNDDCKIRALMIYFDHWGNEQKYLENKIRDFVATMDKIKSVFEDEDNEDDFSLVTEVRFLAMHIQHGLISPTHCLNQIANELLSGMGGTVQRPTVHSPAWKLAKNLHISVHHVLAARMDLDTMRSVDAIVVL